jgi:hypothetical protein
MYSGCAREVFAGGGDVTIQAYAAAHESVVKPIKAIQESTGPTKMLPGRIGVRVVVQSVPLFRGEDGEERCAGGGHVHHVGLDIRFAIFGPDAQVAQADDTHVCHYHRGAQKSELSSWKDM